MTKTVPDSRSRNAQCSGTKIGAKRGNRTQDTVRRPECARTDTALGEKTEIFRLTDAMKATMAI